MKPEDLKRSLEDLRAVLGELESGDEHAGKHLRAVLETLERKASQPECEEQHATALERVAEGIDQLRLEHPRTAELLNRILVSLSEAGI